MVLVDSSVWIDYFRNVVTREVEELHRLLDTIPILVGDVVMLEVLQGCGSDRQFRAIQHELEELVPIALGGHDIMVAAAQNYRSLRALGITIRKTIDTIIATRCIRNNIPLLFSDRDFEPFVQHLGLKSAMEAAH